MIRVYVAASSAPPERDRARRVMAALRMAGAVVTSTWVEAIEAAGAANEGLSPAARRAAGVVCRAEVDAADVLLLLVPHGPSGIGCGWEAGRAEALGLHVIACGPTERTVFAEAVEEHATDREGVAAVLRMAGER